MKYEYFHWIPFFFLKSVSIQFLDYFYIAIISEKGIEKTNITKSAFDYPKQAQKFFGSISNKTYKEINVFTNDHINTTNLSIFML